jgi:N-acetylmuramoyl-L-alanine amidase
VKAKRAILLAGVGLVAALGTVGCKGSPAPAGASSEAGAGGEGTAVGLARAIVEGRAGLPPRPDALALAESVEALAVREGAGARSVDLHTGAARLLEKVWRVEAHPQDAAEALDLYRAAAKSPDAPGACAAALAGARLAGDAASAPSTLYAELYRVARRFPVSSAPSDAREGGCRAEVQRELDLLVAFRPPQRVLEAIDEGLAGEGAIAQALAGVLDGGLSVPVRPPRLGRVEAWSGIDTARVVLVLDRPATYRVGDEAVAGLGRARTFVDLDGVDLGDVARDTPEKGIVQGLHIETTSTGSRALLDLDGHAYRHVFHLEEPFRVVVDIARRPPGASSRSARAVSRVVLDPGHGGKDSGAIGVAGVREKDVTLDVARRVALVLEGQGLQVLLTRKDDVFVSLEERTALANADSADLFVSIHCNASESRSRRGVETYVLDTTRDEIAARVAARENATTQAASAELASILGSMRLADDAARSTHLAQLLDRVATTTLQMKYGDVVDGGVHTAGFYVLVGARMPGVLFETSYLSNPAEEQRLGSPDYRQLLADAIVNAVKAYREGR